MAAVFFLSFIASHLVYIWADAYFYNPITSQRSNFPLSYPMTAKSFMEKHGLLDREEYLKRLAENQGNIDLVSYPLEKLEFNRRVNKLNVLMISVNNLRADALNQDEMPNLYQFAQDNQTLLIITARAMIHTVHLGCSMVYRVATQVVSKLKVAHQLC